jgi:serine/threonine protein kinase
MVEMNPMILIQRYRLDEELGRGSMGTVYRAYDLLLERDVFVKLLNESRLYETGKERLLREARAMARQVAEA